MLLSKEQHRDDVIFNVTYEQIVLDALKKPQTRKKLEELKEKTLLTGKEHAFGVCSNGKITEIVEGTEKFVNIDNIISECDGKIDLNIHSHPPLKSRYSPDYPSESDWIIDLTTLTRLASCIYDAHYDLIYCYTTPDELRNKYAPKIKEAEDEVNSKLISYQYSISELDKRYYKNMYLIKKEDYKKILNETVKEIISYMYPEYRITPISYPYSRKTDAYVWLRSDHPRWGNYRGVWLGRYRFDELYK
jgi:hypothetical protein